MKKTIIIDEINLKKRKLRFWLLFGFFATVLVATVVCGIVLGNHILKSDYVKLQTAIKNNDVSAMSSLYKNDDLLDYEEAVINYEKTFLGTTNINILQDGKVCAREDYILDATNGTLIKIENKNSKTLVDESVSFVNEWNGVVYYRLNETKQLMSYTEDENQVVIEDVRVGQLLMDNGILYYINLDDNAYIYSFNPETGTNKVVVKKSIQYFAITGNKIITMSRTNDFAIYDKKNGLYENGMSNAKHFLLDDRLYLSDGKNVISCSVNLRKEEKIADADGALIAVLDNAVIIQKDGSLAYVSDNLSYLIEKDVDICKYVSLEDGVLSLLIGTSKDDGYSESKITKSISDIIQESNLME